ncbi:hypothetical protein V8B97DRAFT_397867 [Scleroderma yunnanense]
MASFMSTMQSSPATSITQQLADLKVSENSDKIYEEQWVEVPHLKRIVLVRPPRVPGFLHLFGFAVTPQELYHLSVFSFKRVFRGKDLPESNVMIGNAPSFIASCFRIPVCFPAVVQPVPGVDIPSDCLFSPELGGGVYLLVVWQDCESGRTCPYPWHIREFEKIIGRPPRWWLDDDPEWAYTNLPVRKYD